MGQKWARGGRFSLIFLLLLSRGRRCSSLDDGGRGDGRINKRGFFQDHSGGEKLPRLDVGIHGHGGTVSDRVCKDRRSRFIHKSCLSSDEMRDRSGGGIWLHDETFRTKSDDRSESGGRGAEARVQAVGSWDHAYHPKNKDLRENYIAAWWNVVNWSFMSRAYAIVTSPLAMGSL